MFIRLDMVILYVALGTNKFNGKKDCVISKYVLTRCVITRYVIKCLYCNIYISIPFTHLISR